MNSSDALYDVLNKVYSVTEYGGFVDMDTLETEFGLSGSKLRPLLEDLKAKLFVVEHEEGFQITKQGLHHCKSIWA